MVLKFIYCYEAIQKWGRIRKPETFVSKRKCVFLTFIFLQIFAGINVQEWNQKLYRSCKVLNTFSYPKPILDTFQMLKYICKQCYQKMSTKLKR